MNFLFQCMMAPGVSQFIWVRSCNESIRDFLAQDQIIGAIGGVAVVFGLIEVRPLHVQCHMIYSGASE